MQYFDSFIKQEIPCIVILLCMVINFYCSYLASAKTHSCVKVKGTRLLRYVICLELISDYNTSKRILQHAISSLDTVIKYIQSLLTRLPLFI